MDRNHIKEAADRWLQGAVSVPTWSVPSDVESWERRRMELRSQLCQLLGELPPRPVRPQLKPLGVEDRGSYRLEKFAFDNAAGAAVSGYWVIPAKCRQPAPAVLWCHWHGRQYDLGAREIFEKAHTPEVPAEALAGRGYVVLAIDAYCFGDRSGTGPSGSSERGAAEESSASKFNLWLGRSLWGMILRDDLMALDILAARPEVDASRIGVTGISMGATRSWWLMALDERLRAGVAMACMTRYQDLIQTGGLEEHGIYYYVPGMLRHFDTEAVIALIAPRPVLFLTGARDSGSPLKGIHNLGQAVSPIWPLLGKAGQFESVVYPGIGHECTLAMWDRMLDWFERYLG